MARMCEICEGLITAQNEVVGYSGPMCVGHPQRSFKPDTGLKQLHDLNLKMRVDELERQLETVKKFAQLRNKLKGE